MNNSSIDNTTTGNDIFPPSFVRPYFSSCPSPSHDRHQSELYYRRFVCQQQQQQQLQRLLQQQQHQHDNDDHNNNGNVTNKRSRREDELADHPSYHTRFCDSTTSNNGAGAILALYHHTKVSSSTASNNNESCFFRLSNDLSYNDSRRWWGHDSPSNMNVAADISLAISSIPMSITTKPNYHQPGALLPPFFDESSSIGSSSKEEIITYAAAVPLPGMEQEMLLAAKLRVVMALQQPGCYWSEQINRIETHGGNAGLLRSAQVSCWSSRKAVDEFRFSPNMAEYLKNYADMFIPDSLVAIHYRRLRNPYFDQLSQALRQRQRSSFQRTATTKKVEPFVEEVRNHSSKKVDHQHGEKDCSNDDNHNNKQTTSTTSIQELTESQEQCCISTSRGDNKDNQQKLKGIYDGTIAHDSQTWKDTNGNFVTNPFLKREPAYSVFIHVCPKKPKGAKEISTFHHTQHLFTSLLFASEACAVHEEGCLRYMILTKRQRSSDSGSKHPHQQSSPRDDTSDDKQQTKQEETSASSSSKSQKSGDEPKLNNSTPTPSKKEKSYTIYAVFVNEDAFQFHSQQGYSVLSERFTELCERPAFPSITAYTRNPI